MQNDTETFERQIFGATTIIYSKLTLDEQDYFSQATGFFYNDMSPRDETQYSCYNIDKQWLITNRHAILHKINGVEYVPDEFSFHYRQFKDNIEWETITLTKDSLLEKLRLHKNPEIDVALLDVTEYLLKHCNKESEAGTFSNLIFGAISNLKLPDNSPLTIDVTTDIVVASYPKGFYDTYNKFPIIKSGIIASAWGFHFNGEPIFQIDAQLFPGSSGGLVISKPTQIAVMDGQPKHCNIKDFVFLGIYSGEYYWIDTIRLQNGEIVNQQRSYGLGNVWYSYLVPEIINQGISYKSTE